MEETNIINEKESELISNDDLENFFSKELEKLKQIENGKEIDDNEKSIKIVKSSDELKQETEALENHFYFIWSILFKFVNEILIKLNKEILDKNEEKELKKAILEIIKAYSGTTNEIGAIKKIIENSGKQGKIFQLIFVIGTIVLTRLNLTDILLNKK